MLELTDEVTLSKGQGCAHCSGSGYSGRVGIYETLWMNPKLEEMIHQGKSDEEIKHKALEDGLLSTLWEDSKTKVLEGTTTLKEAKLLYNAH